jgi:hypothetical protein
LKTNTEAPCRRILASVFIGVFLLLSAPSSSAYSVLTHEQVIDFAWEQHIKRLLLDRYPNASADELHEAHAYAYGGSLIQDMGYYPFGNKFFSDLVHYVRSGDFVVALIRDAQNLNELAFALGALGHYAADLSGHPAVNSSVSLVFPKLHKKYGSQVTYEDDPTAHIRTEFGFDVLQLAKQQYTSQAYHDFIGFEVTQPLLERAFLEVYGIPLSEILLNEDRSIGSYRRSVSKWIPQLTQVALVTKRKELEALPDYKPPHFRYLLSRSQYERDWGKNYQKPGLGSRILAVIVKVLPKIGPLKSLDVKVPTAETQRMYIHSVEDTITLYNQLLTQFETGQLQLPDRDYDTGNPTSAGEYELADETYARLVQKLADNAFAQMSPSLHDNILDFYADLSKPIATKKHKKEWKETLRDLAALKAHP